MLFREFIAHFRQDHPETQLALVAIVSAMIAYYILPRVKQISSDKGLHAIVNHRSSHSKPVSNMGGIPIMAAVLLTTLSLNNLFSSPRLQYVLAAMFLLFLIGIYDDIHVLNAMKKLFGQVIAATLITVGGALNISSFYGLFGIQAIPEWASIPFTIIAIIGIINAVNMIDGINGLCGGLGIISLLFFSSWSIANDDHMPWRLLSVAYIGAMIPFLRFNLFYHIGKRERIFLGDNGSMPLGALLAGWAVMFCEAYNDKGNEATLYPHLEFAPLVALAAMFIPVTDTLCVMSIRILRGQSPLHADRSHIHHQWLRLGLSHLQVSLILWVCQLVILVLACCLAPQLGYGWLSLIMLIYAIIIYSLPRILYRLRPPPPEEFDQNKTL